MVKNCDLGLENAAQYFQDLGHSFSPYRPPSRQITYIYLKMITIYTIREMVSFELGEEIEKDVFRLVISVGQKENLSLFLY